MRPTLLLVALTACAGFDAGSTSDALTVDPMVAPWDRHAIARKLTGLDGADGGALGDVNGDGLMDVVSAHEEGGYVTVSEHPPVGSDPTMLWATATWMPAAPHVEDAKFGDFDRDGILDIVATSDGGQRIYIVGRNGDPTTFQTLTASLGHNRWMQADTVDVDGDGCVDIVAGGRGGSAANPAVLAWFGNPCGSNTWDGSAWTYHEIARAGWTMSLQALMVHGNVAVFTSDRTFYKNAAGVVMWDHYGGHWLEQTAPGVWTNYQIDTAGSCPTCTPGDAKMYSLVDLDGDGVLDVAECVSGNAGQAPSRTHLTLKYNTANWGAPSTWVAQALPFVEGAGQCQHIAPIDLNGDGLLDMVVTTDESDALPASPAIGIYGLLNLGAGAWQAIDIAGPAGTKYDNAIFDDVDADGRPDLIAEEQVGDGTGTPGADGRGQGVSWYRNPL